jgi:hypothetical protein
MLTAAALLPLTAAARGVLLLLTGRVLAALLATCACIHRRRES